LVLLERGYDRKQALDLVTARWGLSRLERLVLYRGIFDFRTSHSRMLKLDREPKRLAIDGFNVLSTIQSAMLNDTLIRATDGFVRDLAATTRKVRVTQLLLSALAVMLNFVDRLNVDEVVVVFDAQVGRSGELAGLTRMAMERHGLRGDALTHRQADSFLASLSDRYTVATSDSLLLDRVRSAFDLGGAISVRIAEENVINLRRCVVARVGELAQALAERARAHDEETWNEGAPAGVREGDLRTAR